jgi:hypothetical protein
MIVAGYATAAIVHAVIVGEGDCSAERIREEAKGHLEI